MPIDYSKWDKIELSDDSDIEVHPNVDKTSFIRWKQQSIHEKRQERTRDIKNLEMQLKMYSFLNKRVDKLIQTLPLEQYGNMSEVTKLLNANFDKNEKCTGDNVDPEIGTYNEMVEDLFDQLKHDIKKDGKDSSDNALIKEYLLKHRKKIDKVSEEGLVKLTQLYKEKNDHISSEDIHTGFDSSFMNKKGVQEDTAQVEKSLKTLEVANSAQKKADALEGLPLMRQFIDYGSGEENLDKIAPETLEFGLSSWKDYGKSERYLLKHMEILSEQQKDALMMKAFEFELQGETAKTYQIIHQSELMAYVIELYQIKKIPFLNDQEMTQVINMFFQRIINNTADSRGKQSFLDSVTTKYNHVKSRCQLMQREANEQGDGESEENAVIQLRSLDESSELEINMPDFNSADAHEVARCEAFNKMPKDLQDALKTGTLDAVNEVLGNYTYEQGESMLALFDEAEIIGVKALLEGGEDEFDQLKEQYDAHNKIVEEPEEESDSVAPTSDIVD
ncbi:hsp90 co-chaperone Cdc37 [Monosporozyma servazzii]